ncbi:hypothetical protein V2J09_011879 [Rumex salicifolius]
MAAHLQIPSSSPSSCKSSIALLPKIQINIIGFPATSTACLSRSLGFASISVNGSLRMDSDQNSQPIVFSSSCLRRTLSADMASEKWKSQSGLKKSASVENFRYQEDDEDNGGPGFGSGSGAFDEIWSSIQGEQWDKKKEEETEKPRSQTDIWSSILSQKTVNDQDANNTGETLPPPYIHPLMKRSSSLSEKSLEVCTESLGSETGSDIFSPDPDSDSGQEEFKDVIVEATKETEPPLQQEAKVVAVKTKGSVAGGGSPTRSFPPPLPSLSNGGDGSNVQMRSHRENGRLVLEAVSVPSNNCFKAKRHDGRLLLTFSDRHVSDSDVADVDTERDEFEHDDVIEQESDAEEEDDDVAYGTHKFLGLTKSINSDTWQRRLNRVVNTLEDDDDDCYVKSTAAAMDRGVNPYVYSWRSMPGPGPIVMETQLGDDEEGKRAGKVDEEVIPLYLRGCNLQQPRRPVLMWEAHCIAT